MRKAVYTVEQCRAALARADSARDTQAVARWTARLKAAVTDSLRAFKRANRKRRAA